MDKTESKAKKQTILCPLLGSNLCPKPQKCNGLKRECTLWRIHSGR